MKLPYHPGCNKRGQWARSVPATEITAFQIMRIDINGKTRVFTHQKHRRSLLQVNSLPTTAFCGNRGLINAYFFRPSRGSTAGQSGQHRHQEEESQSPRTCFTSSCFHFLPVHQHNLHRTTFARLPNCPKKRALRCVFPSCCWPQIYTNPDKRPYQFIDPFPKTARQYTSINQSL